MAAKKTATKAEAKLDVKSIVLYDRHKIRPQTLLAIHEASNGAIIGVEPSELAAFKALTIMVPADHPDVVAALQARQLEQAKEDAA